VVFAWPLDFTFVCPTEIAEFGKRNGDFADRDAQVLGLSCDSEYVHLAWRNSSTPTSRTCRSRCSPTGSASCAGARHPAPQEGIPLRATYIVDPQGVIRFVSVHDLDVGRNVDEVLRTLDALQTGELCPCNWKKGEKTLEVK
jgi:alkyl hydroperoxide reductase subunit AhpC